MKEKLFTKDFKSLLVTQFLGAANDNVLKIIIGLQMVGGIWSGEFGDGGQGIVTLIFTLPFILFSGWSGQIADKVSKQKLTCWVKIAEIGIALIALIALWQHSLWLAIVTLLALAMQSTVFGPAKYGMIPELFSKKSLGKANGAINMLTNIAILLGSLIGGVLSNHYPQCELMPGVVLLIIAVSGYISSRFLSTLPAHDPTITLSANPILPYLKTLAVMYKRRQLIVVALGWAFFDIIGAMTLSAILDFKELLSISDTQTSWLNIPLGIGVGAGSALAGILSRKQIKTTLVPVGALGITLVFAMMGAVEMTYTAAWGFLSILGLFGGLYVVPLQALIQAMAPLNLRGRVMGTTNFLGFSFIAAGGGLYWFLRAKVELDVQQLLVFCSGMTLLGAGYLNWRIRSLFNVEGNVIPGAEEE